MKNQDTYQYSLYNTISLQKTYFGLINNTTKSNMNIITHGNTQNKKQNNKWELH
jgi:hypothetical protein